MSGEFRLKKDARKWHYMWDWDLHLCVGIIQMLLYRIIHVWPYLSDCMLFIYFGLQIYRSCITENSNYSEHNLSEKNSCYLGSAQESSVKCTT